jgi:hypothetical protein
VIRGRWRDSGFWVYWRVPHVRKYHIEFEMDLRQFLFGFCYYRVGFALCCGPFELSVERRCDCCP